MLSFSVARTCFYLFCAKCLLHGFNRVSLIVCSVLSLPQPSTQSLQHIFQTQLGRFFNSREFSAEVRGCRSLLVATAIAIYRQVAANLRPTPFKIHYTFNVRDLSQVLYLLVYRPNHICVTLLQFCAIVITVKFDFS